MRYLDYASEEQTKREDRRLRISLMLPVTVRNGGETFILQPEPGLPIWIGNEKLQTLSLARFQRSGLHCDNPLSRTLRTLLREFCFISLILLHVKCIILCDSDEAKFNIRFKSRVIRLKCKAIVNIKEFEMSK